jgi:thiol-disulfide isomerase/thioredoxin
MKHPRLLTLLLLASCYTLALGQQNTPSTAQILIDCDFCVGQKAAANVVDLFSNGFSRLAETEVDAAGKAAFILPVSGPLFAYITVGTGLPEQDSLYRVYLEPDQVLKLRISNEKLEYTGKLSLANHYLDESRKVTNIVWDEANAISGQFKTFTREEKGMVAISFSKRFAPLHEAITNDSRLTAQQKEILIDQNKLLVQWKMKGMEGSDWDKLKEGSSYEVPSFLSELPVRPDYVSSFMDSYRRVIELEIRTHLVGSIFYALEKEGFTNEKVGMSRIEDTLTLLTDRAIRANPRLAPIREFLLAKNINLSFIDFGFSPQLVQNFTKFKEEYPNSSYLPPLEMMVGNHMQLGEGTEARDFTATDANGHAFRLSDLKGKVVYIDTWATWCGPCIAEFPHSKRMMEHYKDNNDVVFLFVSVDEDTQKWKSFLKGDRAPRGIHVNQNSASTPDGSSIFSLYNMSGIPHYILVDKAGKIKVNRGPRPSEKESYELIDGLLE